MKEITADQLRKLYIDFFVSKGHKQISGASLIPENDPTISSEQSIRQERGFVIIRSASALEISIA